jgi:hypothetical protein
MLVGPPVPLLLSGFFLQAVFGILAGFGVWRALGPTRRRTAGREHRRYRPDRADVAETEQQQEVAALMRQPERGDAALNSPRGGASHM